MRAVDFDYSKLKGKIVEKFDTQEAFAKALNISSHSLSAKLAGKSMFSQKEITTCCKLLDITKINDIGTYFFTKRVQ